MSSASTCTAFNGIVLCLTLSVAVTGACVAAGHGDAASARTVPSSIQAGNSRSKTGTGEPIVLGLVTPLSGSAAPYGKDYENVANLYARAANSHGGLSGHHVVVQVSDDQGQPAVGVSQALRLITDAHASAILGTVNSSVAVAEMNVVSRYNVPLMQNYTWADQITAKNYPQVFRIGPYNSLIAKLMVPFLIHKRFKNVAVVAEDTDYGIGFANALKAAAGRQLNVQVVQFQAQTSDLSPELSKLAHQNPQPDAVIAASNYAARNLFFNQAKEMGLKSQLIAGWDYVTSPDFWTTVGAHGVNVIYPTFYASSLKLTPVGQTFQSLYKASYHQEPPIYDYFLWDCMNALKAAVQKSNSVAPSDLVRVLPSVSFQGTTGQISFSHVRGTVHYNQWENVTMFFKSFTKVNQTDAQAKVIYVSR